ncbi:MAG: NepR family anti-sigma factor [Shimia sp.]
MAQPPKTSRLEREIDENLKRAYDDVLKEDIPDRFTKLLDDLRAREAAARGGQDGVGSGVGADGPQATSNEGGRDE